MFNVYSNTSIGMETTTRDNIAKDGYTVSGHVPCYPHEHRNSFTFEYEQTLLLFQKRNAPVKQFTNGRNFNIKSWERFVVVYFK